MLPQGRQLKTNAHPLVDITLMKQGDHHLVHLVNISRHSETGYFNPIAMNHVKVEVKGTFHTARAIRTGKDLPLTRRGAYCEFILPALAEYELVELR